MKTTVLIMAFALMATVTLAQNQNIQEIEVRAPWFTGTIYNSLNDFLAQNIEYPEKMSASRMQGTVVVECNVSTDGKLSNFNVINSVSPEFDSHVIQVLKTTDGKWNPGKVNGNPANMKTEVSVVFFLHSKEDLVKTAKDFNRRGNELLFEKNNPKKALKFFNLGIQLLPNEEGLLAMRCLCNYKLGNIVDAKIDLERIRILAARNGSKFRFENWDNLAELIPEAKTISE